MIKPNFFDKKNFIRGEKLYKDAGSGQDFGVGVITSTEQLDQLIENNGGVLDNDGAATGAKPDNGAAPAPDAGKMNTVTQPAEQGAGLSDEDLEKLISENGKDIGGDEGAGDAAGAEGKKGDKGGEGTAAANAADTGEGDEGVDEELKAEIDGYANTVDMLNQKYKLGLNEEAIKDIDQTTERGTVLELVDRVIKNSQARIQEFGEVKDLLEDEEIAGFIAAKKEGKTLRDYVTEFGTTPQGSGDEDVVYSYLKANSPVLDDEAIKSTIETLKEKGKFEQTVTSARKAQEDAIIAQENLDAENMQKSLDNYKNYLNSQDQVFGITLTDKLKTQFYDAVAQVDENGMTFLERSLQSNENVLKAVIAIAGMDKVVAALGTTEGNRKKKSFVEKLTDDPSTLQSGKEKPKDIKFDDNEYYEIANQTGSAL